MATPQLRFKEFDGDWSTVTLEYLAEVERGKFSVRPRNDPRYFGGEMPFVQTGDVTGSDVYLKGYTQTLNENGIRVSKVFPAGTILITIAANIGDTTITQYPVACPDSVVAIQPKRDKANTTFLKNIIDLQKDNLDSQATQNAQKNINLQVLKPLELIVPSKEEQTKIAAFLSAVDEKISQLTQKHELLSQYKQGMMQKLFSQQIRFKADDGSEFGEWGNYKLKDIADIYDGTHQTPNYVEQGVPFYSVEHVTANDFSNTKFIAEDVYQAELKRVSLQKGDILMTRIGDIGTSRLIDWDVRASFYVSLALIKIRNEDNSSFINQYIKSQNFQRELHERTIHVAFPKKINLGEIGLCMIKLPCLEEQTKIANFLSSLDQKIDVVAEQIQHAKHWKKGLLQQMFV